MPLFSPVKVPFFLAIAVGLGLPVEKIHAHPRSALGRIQCKKYAKQALRKLFYGQCLLFLKPLSP